MRSLPPQGKHHANVVPQPQDVLSAGTRLASPPLQGSHSSPCLSYVHALLMFPSPSDLHIPGPLAHPADRHLFELGIKRPLPKAIREVRRRRDHCAGIGERVELPESSHSGGETASGAFETRPLEDVSDVLRPVLRPILTADTSTLARIVSQDRNTPAQAPVRTDERHDTVESSEFFARTLPQAPGASVTCANERVQRGSSSG